MRGFAARSLAGLLLGWASTWSLMASAHPASPARIEVADDRGGRVQLAAPARRVVSLLPSLTENICALGACDRLVAVDRWSNWPDVVRALPRAGGLEDADIEMILSRRPDLVVAAPSSKVAARLRSLGLQVAEFDAQSIDDVRRVNTMLGQLLGQEAQAERLWQRLQAQRAQARRAMLASSQGMRVYVEIGSTPYAASESSFIGELLADLGTRNVVPKALGPYPQINPEFVLRADPRVIIVAQSDAAAMGLRPGWGSLDAMRQRRVCAMPAAEFDVIVRPGPRLGDAALLLSRCLARWAPAPPSPARPARKAP